jgi:uncharacterized protein YndB with AHSA1/START domain
MPVTDVTKDFDNRTLTITAEFAAPLERVWQLYEDPRQLEQVWGPPEYPATFVDHRLAPGTRSTYFMTSPEGEKFAGYWDITSVESPSRFTFDDGFAHEDFTPNAELPASHNVYEFTSVDSATRAVFTSAYESADDLQKVLDMGMEEGATSAINQADAFLARDEATSRRG